MAYCCQLAFISSYMWLVTLTNLLQSLCLAAQVNNQNIALLLRLVSQLMGLHYLITLTLTVNLVQLITSMTLKAAQLMS